MLAYDQTSPHEMQLGAAVGPGLLSLLGTDERIRSRRLSHGVNIQTACPPRTAVPVHQGRGFSSLFHLSTPASSSVMDATVPAMSPELRQERDHCSYPHQKIPSPVGAKYAAPTELVFARGLDSTTMSRRRRCRNRQQVDSCRLHGCRHLTQPSPRSRRRG